MKAEITTIKFKIGDRDIELTAHESRALHAGLCKLFQMELQYIPVPYVPPFTWPPQRDIITIDPPWQPDYWKITCGEIPSSNPSSVLLINTTEA